MPVLCFTTRNSAIPYEGSDLTMIASLRIIIFAVEIPTMTVYLAPYIIEKGAR